MTDVGIDVISPTYFQIGGLLHDIGTIYWGTTDFFFSMDLTYNRLYSFNYSVDGVIDDFSANFGDIHADAATDIPEPATLALLGIASLAGIAMSRRNKI